MHSVTYISALRVSGASDTGSVGPRLRTSSVKGSIKKTSFFEKKKKEIESALTGRS